MRESMKRVIAGIGSVLAIMPSTNYASFIPRQTPSERMSSNWGRAGDHLRHAISQFANGQAQQK